METKIVFFLLLALGNTVNANVGNSTQRFQADKFLDMLSRSFDPNVAYNDLMSALNRRLKSDNATLGGGGSIDSNPSMMVDSVAHCPEAPLKPGASVTYTSDNRVVGSRAFYQCEAGYEGRSLFIQCTNGGVWSTPTGWEGCKAVDCGAPPPSVVNGDSSYTTTTFGSMVIYTCHAGYKPDKQYANVTCLDTGYWDTPTFACQKASLPSLDMSNLAALSALFSGGGGSGSSAATNTNQIQHIHQLQQLAGTLIKARQVQVKSVRSKLPSGPALLFASLPPARPVRPSPPLIRLPQMTARAPQNVTQFQFPPQVMAALGNQLMAALLKNMQGFSGFPGMTAVPPTPTPTTTTPKPSPASHIPMGFQLPSHLQSLLPNGISNAQGFKSNDLMTLASLGLGSASSAAAPRDITQLLGSMNPMSILGPAMGLPMPGTGTPAAGGAAAPPIEPEKMVEQREEMMMRAMMANAMKSMMQPRASANGTAQARPNSNPAMEMMTLMALQSGLSGAGGGAAGSSATSGFDPMAMMLGGMNPAMLGLGGGGGAGGLFGGLFGGA